MLNKKQLLPIAAFAVILIVYNVLAFVLPFAHKGPFWTAYVFGLISIFVSAAVIALAFNKTNTPKSRFYGFPIARVGVLYALIQLPLSFITMALSRIGDLPVWPFALVFVLLLAFALLGTIGAEAARTEVERIENDKKNSTASMKQFGVLSAGLADRCSDPEAKRAVTRLADALRYSDPVSGPATAAAEEELGALLNELRSAVASGDAASVQSVVNTAMNVLDERNRLCRLNK